MKKKESVFFRPFRTTKIDISLRDFKALLEAGKDAGVGDTIQCSYQGNLILMFVIRKSKK